MLKLFVVGNANPGEGGIFQNRVYEFDGLIMSVQRAAGVGLQLLVCLVFRRAARRGLCDSDVSVCLSVTRRYCA